MSVDAWRIYKPKHSADAFTGEGARQYGGRWNNKGVALIYAAGSLSLAALEMLVHLSTPDLLATYEVRRATFAEDLIERLAPSMLPDDWQALPAPIALRTIGDNWARELRSAVLRVPSAIVPSEHNYLLNPAHPDFKRITLGDAEPFAFDPRLLK